MSILDEIKFPQSDEFVKSISFTRASVHEFLRPISGAFFYPMEKPGVTGHVRESE
jgi:hypothetical protein